MYVIGTTGHVDHGKSTLIEALTGIDPDRLDEEKRRGMTIDLGFAWATLPSGREISIVDVPGHEKFIKNMLAGVGSIDLALLIVAADESVMPQTREHLGVLTLLEIPKVIVVITKSDMVDSDLLPLVELEINELLDGTTFSNSTICTVSSTQKIGLEELQRHIDRLLPTSTDHADNKQPRMPVDRVFSISGFGTVVTGTLIGGTLSVGQSITVHPQALNGRIRGIQSHKKDVVTIGPGNRIALNLGGIKPTEVSRGNIISLPNLVKPTWAIDTKLKLLPDAPHGIPHNFPVSFHAYTSETQAKIRLLDSNELLPGTSAWAQIVFTDKLSLIEGDRFIVRSSDSTIGGGTILKVHAKRHRRNNNKVINALNNYESNEPIAQIYALLESNEPITSSELSSQLGIAESDIEKLIQSSVESAEPLQCLYASDYSISLIYKVSTWRNIILKIHSEIQKFHQSNPLKAGVSLEEIRSKLNLNPAISSIVFANLDDADVYINQNGLLVSKAHKITLSSSQLKELEHYLEALENDPFLITHPQITPELQAFLVSEGKLIRTTQNVFFTPNNYDKFKRIITDYLSKNQNITVAETRDLLSTSRKYALAILECLDDHKITRRRGETRILL